MEIIIHQERFSLDIIICRWSELCLSQHKFNLNKGLMKVAEGCPLTKGILPENRTLTNDAHCAHIKRSVTWTNAVFWIKDSYQPYTETTSFTPNSSNLSFTKFQWSQFISYEQVHLIGQSHLVCSQLRRNDIHIKSAFHLKELNHLLSSLSVS